MLSGSISPNNENIDRLKVFVLTHWLAPTSLSNVFCKETQNLKKRLEVIQNSE